MTLDFEEIARVTQFAINKYNIRRPKGMSIRDFCHEVSVYMFLYCHLDKPGATAIIKNVRWVSARLFKQIDDTNHLDFVSMGKMDSSLDLIDTKDEVDEILNLPLNDQDKAMLEDMVDGYTGGEIAGRMEVSRQTFHNLKNRLFNKIKVLN